MGEEKRNRNEWFGAISCIVAVATVVMLINEALPLHFLWLFPVAGLFLGVTALPPMDKANSAGCVGIALNLFPLGWLVLWQLRLHATSDTDTSTCIRAKGFWLRDIHIPHRAPPPHRTTTVELDEEH